MPAVICAVVAPRSEDSELAVRVAARVPSTRVTLRRGRDDLDVGDRLQLDRVGGGLARVLAGVGDRLLLVLGLEGLGATLAQRRRAACRRRSRRPWSGRARRSARRSATRRPRSAGESLKMPVATGAQSGSVGVAGRGGTSPGWPRAASAGSASCALAVLDLPGERLRRPSARSALLFFSAFTWSL